MRSDFVPDERNGGCIDPEGDREAEHADLHEGDHRGRLRRTQVGAEHYQELERPGPETQRQRVHEPEFSLFHQIGLFELVSARCEDHFVDGVLLIHYPFSVDNEDRIVNKSRARLGISSTCNT